MKQPDEQVPEKYNWADYCDALWTESFMQSFARRGVPQNREYSEDSVKPARPADFSTLDRSNWAEYCDALRNEGFLRSLAERDSRRRRDRAAA
jgi:hypothetical protein